MKKHQLMVQSTVAKMLIGRHLSAGEGGTVLNESRESAGEVIGDIPVGSPGNQIHSITFTGVENIFMTAGVAFRYYAPNTSDPDTWATLTYILTDVTTSTVIDQKYQSCTAQQTKTGLIQIPVAVSTSVNNLDATHTYTLTTNVAKANPDTQIAAYDALTSVVGIDPGSGGDGGGGGTTIEYNGAAAWAHTAESGVIFNSLNIASVDKIGTGVYEYKFIIPMPAASYSVVHSINTNNALSPYTSHVYDETVNGFKIRTVRADNYLAVDIGHSVTVHATNALPPKGGTGADAWGTCDSAGALTNSFNMTSVAKVSTGIYEYTFTTPMPSNTYAVLATAAGGGRNAAITNKTTDSFRVVVTDSTGAVTDQTTHVVVHATNAALPFTVTKAQLTSAVAAADGVETLTQTIATLTERIEQLEADHAQMMNNNGGSY